MNLKCSPDGVVHHLSGPSFRSPEVVNLYAVVAVVGRPEVSDTSGRNSQGPKHWNKTPGDLIKPVT